MIAALVAASIVAVVLSPAFDRLCDNSFAWHMVQHLTVMLIVAPIALASNPFRLFLRWFRNGTVAAMQRLRPAHAILHPSVTFASFVGVLWITHFSGIYEYALEHPFAHACEHALYFVAGCLFWAPVVAPPPVRPLPYPVRLFYLLLALPQGALLAFALEAAHSPLYPHYAAELSNAGALADQNNAAAVMWIGGGAIMFAAFLAVFGMWARREAA